jgi:2-succinyl-6-hydroxy-2,4-cyclohexadiene-1-carboxylate synthase
VNSATETPLLLVHGFAQTAESWQIVIEKMPGPRALNAIELPGHGATGLKEGVPTVELARDFVLLKLDETAVDRAVLWGYSQGARVALDFTLEHPERVAALIVESGTAGIEDPLARADRRSRDFALSKRVENSTIQQFVDLWETVPALIDQSPALIDAQRADRLSHDPVALAAVLRGIGQAAYEPMWDRLPEIAVPTLVLSGARDENYTVLAERFAQAIADARHQTIPGAGPAVHLENPDATVAAVQHFLASAGV